MTSRPTGASRWQRIKRVLERALELTATEQESYLDEACAGDPYLRRDVESLLVHAGTDDFLRRGVERAAADALHLTEAVNLEGQELGPWKVDERIAVGGMGAVYEAHRADGAFSKRVAIKVVRQRVANEGGLRRFYTEREILARIDHPQIARLIDAGTTDQGMPYLVMEYVSGDPIDEYCDDRRLTIDQRLELFGQVCNAVQVAHEKHIVHRDLKPSNLLVTEDGRLKLLDFGIAKLLAPEILDRSIEVTTEFQRLMTPAYASPEQIRGEPVTPASDVYSLGVILYTLLCGHSPYDQGNEETGTADCLVADFEPIPPSQALRRFAHVEGPAGESIALTPEAIAEARGTEPEALFELLEAELDGLTLKALSKQPEQRYASAAELGAAIEARAQGASMRARPVIASPPDPPRSEPSGSRESDRPGADGPAETLFEWGHLQALRKVGEGVFGEVYKCRDPSLGMTVALKLFRPHGEGGSRVSPQLANRILREGRLLARVRHPNVVTVYGVAAHEDSVGLWMEYIKGRNLEELLQVQGRFGAREAGLVGVDLCSALAAVHAEGVVHRDIKAQNVIREEGGRIVLTDFGSGQDLIGEMSFADEGTVGTPVYMAPEILRGGDATPRSDIYSLGVLLFRLVTGEFPIEADSWPELVEKHASGDVRSLRDLRADLQPGSPRFVRVLERALDPDPKQRFVSAGQFQQELEVSIDSTADRRQYSLPPTLPGQEDETTGLWSTVLAWGGGGAVALAFFTFLGLMTSLVERQAMRVPQSLANESVFDYLLLGIRASIPAAILWTLPVLVVILLALGIGKLVLRLIRNRAAEDSAVARVPELACRCKELFMSADPLHVAVVLLILGLLANLGLAVVHGDLWNTIGFLSERPIRPEADLSLLADLSAHHRYEFSYGLLFVVGAIAATCMIAAARKQEEDRPIVRLLHVGVIGTIALSAVLLTMPWKLLASDHDYAVFDASSESEEFWRQASNSSMRWVEVDGETVDLHGRRAFVIAHDGTDSWLYFPDIRYRGRVDRRFAEPAGMARIFVSDE